MTAWSSCSNLLTVRSSTSGIIYSNKDGVYSDSMECHWSLSSNTNLELVFFRFETESGYDFVYVYDGGSTSSPLIGQYRGSPLPLTITSSSNQLYVVFTSDGSNTYSGFAASYHGKKTTSNDNYYNYHCTTIVTIIVIATGVGWERSIVVVVI